MFVPSGTMANQIALRRARPAGHGGAVRPAAAPRGARGGAAGAQRGRPAGRPSTTPTARSTPPRWPRWAADARVGWAAPSRGVRGGHPRRGRRPGLAARAARRRWPPSGCRCTSTAPGSGTRRSPRAPRSPSGRRRPPPSPCCVSKGLGAPGRLAAGRPGRPHRARPGSSASGSAAAMRQVGHPRRRRASSPSSGSTAWPTTTPGRGAWPRPPPTRWPGSVDAGARARPTSSCVDAARPARRSSRTSAGAGRPGRARAAPTTVRLVTHADVDDADIDRAVAAIATARRRDRGRPSRRGRWRCSPTPTTPRSACGGTLARWAARGQRGAPRDRQPRRQGQLRPDAPTRTRWPPTGPRRWRGAAEVLGLARRRAPRLPRRRDRQRRRPAGAGSSRSSAACRPDALVAPDPTAVFFGDSYVNHRDHRQLGWAVLDSLVPAASPLYVPEAGPAHQVELVLLSGTLEADAWVDIGAVLDAKVAAVALPREPPRRRPGARRRAPRAARRRGGRAGPASLHAEAFRRLRFTAVAAASVARRGLDGAPLAHGAEGEDRRRRRRRPRRSRRPSRPTPPARAGAVVRRRTGGR